MTLNGIIAFILRYSTEFDRLGGQLRHSGWRETYKVRCRISFSSYTLAKMTRAAVARSLCDS